MATLRESNEREVRPAAGGEMAELLRATRALRDLARDAGRAPSIEECLRLAARSFEQGDLGLPFLLFYALSEDRRTARLVATVGVSPEQLPEASSIDLAAPSSQPLADAIADGRPRAVEEDAARAPWLPGDPRSDAPRRTWLLPIHAGAGGQASAVAVALVGASRRLHGDEASLAFHELLAAGLTNVVTSASAAEAERRRAEALAEIDHVNRELESFSYSVSHDLRAPLRAIDGFSKALLNDYGDRLDDEGRRYLDRVRAASQRMAQLIDDLLALSRITRVAMARERVDLTAISSKILAELGSRDPDRRVDARVAGGLVARGDARLVMVLLENLLGNAWKFTSQRPLAHIDVGSEQRDEEKVFVVKDDGAGFDMAYAEKLFAPFQRLHSPAEFQGTGIGLATVQRIVGRHGGRIWAEAAPDRGATFFFTLGEEAR